MLSPAQIREGYWYHRPNAHFPPKPIQNPHDYDGSAQLNLWCTQTDLPASQQKKLVRQWCELLPTLHGIRTLWFCSKVDQSMFEAACSMSGLEGLSIKWSGIRDISPIKDAQALRFLNVGSSTQIPSIEPLAQMQNLKWLDIEHFKQISDLSPIGKLRGLVGLSVQGGMWATQKVASLEPLQHLSELQHLSLINLKAADGSLRPLHDLKKLKRFLHAAWWSKDELARLDASLPALEHQ